MKRVTKKAVVRKKKAPKRVRGSRKRRPQSFGKDAGARFIHDDEPDNPYLGIMNKD